MNNPSPLVPQSSFLEQKNLGRTRVRIAVFFVLSIHVIGLMALLVQGCHKPAEPMSDMNTNTPPPFDTNLAPSVESNTAMPSVMAPPPTTPAPLPPPTGTEYTVAKGDSFSTIAKKFGVSVKAIEVANPGVEPTKLQIGQKLNIPPAAPATGSTPAAASTGDTGAATEQTYSVKSGDTLTKIATEFGTTVKAIRSANNLTTDRITVGQKLKIPPRSTAPSTPAAPAAPSTNTTA
jgi:LysM repeat protein